MCALQRNTPPDRRAKEPHVAFDNIQNDRPIVTRKETMAAGLKYYFTGKACPFGHIDTRHVGGGCVPCERGRVKVRNRHKYATDEGHRNRALAHSRKQMERIRGDPDAVLAENAQARERYKRRRGDSEWSALERDKWRELKRAYYKDNPGASSAQNQKRRARVAGAEGRHTAEDIRKILKRQKYKCVYCSADLKKGFHADHIMPLSLGGSNWPSNIQATCPSCNISKGAKHPLDFAKEKGRLV